MLKRSPTQRAESAVSMGCKPTMSAAKPAGVPIFMADQTPDK
jgi:hypothetical protein